jgi:DNA-binding XRE family transcriptional regulator
MTVQTIRTADGEEKVLLSVGEYPDLIDARDHAVALRGLADGSIETLTEAELDDYLAAATPLAFWRQRRGLTRAALAAAAGVPQDVLAKAEDGQQVGDVTLYAKLARALRMRIEDLVALES